MMAGMVSYKSVFAYFAFWPRFLSAKVLAGIRGRPMNITGVTCAAVLLLAGSAAAQNGGKSIQKTTISLGTATPGGGFPLYGSAFAEVMNEADPTISIEPRNTRGSNENIPLLEGGRLDIALVAGEPAYEALAGIGRPPTRLKILTAMYSSPGMFVVRADSPYRTIRDLVSKPVAFGARGSGLPILSRYLLDGLGLKQDQDFRSIYLDRAGDGPAMVLDGKDRRAMGRGRRLARIQGSGGRFRRRKVHRAGRRRDRAHQGQAQLPQAVDCSGRQLSKPERADQFARLMELHSGAREFA
jgi:NMT1-like family